MKRYIWGLCHIFHSLLNMAERRPDIGHSLAKNMPNTDSSFDLIPMGLIGILAMRDILP